MDVVARIKQRQDAVRRATRNVLTQVAKHTDVVGGIFGHTRKHTVQVHKHRVVCTFVLRYNVLKLYL
jgi:hypothetical protein